MLQIMVQESSATELDPCARFAYGGAKDFGISILTSKPASSSSGALVFFVAVPSIAALYFGIGFGLNHKNGKEGNDRIPHLEFWKEFPSYVATGFSVTFVALQSTFNKLKAAVSGGTTSGDTKSEEYEEY